MKAFITIAVLCLIAAKQSTAYDKIALYEPWTDVKNESEYDLLLADLGTYMGDADFDAAFTAYTTSAGTGIPSLRGMSLELAVAKASTPSFMGGSTASLFQAYYGDRAFAHNFTLAAIRGLGEFNKVGSTGDEWDDDSRKELATKGASYQNVLQYVIYLLEYGVALCQDGQTSIATGGPRSWDLAWAYFTGSKEGTDGTGSGKGPYALGDKRCGQFGTCDDSGLATNNENARALWEEGRLALKNGQCFKAASNVYQIRAQMAIPLLQGTLREAYEVDPDGGAAQADGLTEVAEGWAFASGVLPLIALCDEDVGSLVWNNTYLNAKNLIPDGYEAVKAAIESVYECMGITCADMGGMMTCDDDTYCPGMEPCSDDDDTCDDDEFDGVSKELYQAGIVGLSVAFAVSFLAAGAMCHLWQLAKKDAAYAGAAKKENNTL